MPCFVQTSIVIHTIYALPAMPPDTMRGSMDSLLYACSQVHTLCKARMYNPWGSIVCAEQSMDCLDPYFALVWHGLPTTRRQAPVSTYRRPPPRSRQAVPD